MAIGTEGQPHERGEFLVASRDLPLVRRLVEDRLSLRFEDFVPAFDEHGVQLPPRTNDIEESRTLGLARVRLADPAAVLAAVKGVVGSHPGPRLGAVLGAGAAAPSDALLAFIADTCTALYHGWTPVTGKNLDTSSVHAAPYVSIGAGQRYPQPAPDESPFVGDVTDTPFGQPDWVNVGILDTGFLPRGEFQGRWLRNGPNPVLQNDDEPPPHVVGHATFIAGLVLSTAPNSLLHVGQVLDRETGSAGVWDVAKAMMRLDKSVKVLNLSFCCFTDNDEPPLALRHALERLSPTTVVVAAAGNHGDPHAPRQSGDPGPTRVMWPAAMDRVIAVGAHDWSGNRSAFSPDVPWVRLTALGEDIPSHYLPGKVRMNYRPEDAAGREPVEDFGPTGMAKWSGTSFASAVVAGLIARDAAGGDWGAHEALQRILQAVDGGSHKFDLFGVPILRAAVVSPPPG